MEQVAPSAAAAAVAAATTSFSQIFSTTRINLLLFAIGCAFLEKRMAAVTITVLNF